MMARERAAAARERGDLAEAAYWSAVANTVDVAPPITPEMKERLRVLLRRPAGREGAKAA